jgi:hypothetical protein
LAAGEAESGVADGVANILPVERLEVRVSRPRPRRRRRRRQRRQRRQSRQSRALVVNFCPGWGVGDRALEGPEDAARCNHVHVVTPNTSTRPPWVL